MNINFYGAVDTVTGSMHVISVAGKKILLDCGLYQGKREEADRRNRNFPFKPSEIDYMVLSHAHIDHSGNIPNLVKQGFSGPIFCTPATRDLCSIMLMDSAIIQQRESEMLLKTKGIFVEPIYQVKHVTQAMALFTTIPYGNTIQIMPEVSITFYNAAHILGSAVTLYVINENGKETKIAFTGDYGRHNHPILNEPETVEDVDYVITESTYGGRFHENRELVKEKLLKIILETHQVKGKIIIPAFSVERTQDLLYYLNGFYNKKLLPKIPVYVDSPLSTAATNIFRLHTECYNDALKKMIYEDPDPFGFESLKFITTAEESHKIVNKKGSAIIIAGSGMCESGRILVHLSHTLQKAKNTVLFIGYNAENTLGRKLEDGAKLVNIMGSVHKVRARIEKIDGMSSHGDQRDLMEFAGKQDPKTTKVFIVHGESTGQKALQAALESKGYDAIIPKRGETIQLSADS